MLQICNDIQPRGRSRFSTCIGLHVVRYRDSDISYSRRSGRLFLQGLINFSSTRNRVCARVSTLDSRTSSTIVTECRRARLSDGLCRRLISLLLSVIVGPITDRFINYSYRTVGDHSSCKRVLCIYEVRQLPVTPAVSACRVAKSGTDIGMSPLNYWDACIHRGQSEVMQRSTMASR